MTNDTHRTYLSLHDRFEKSAREVGEYLLTSSNKGQRNALGTTHLGNEHIAIPAFLIADPILEPVDKAVYNSIRLLTPKQTTSESTAYPTYRDICDVANIASDATISRALIILRMTRWISQRTISSNNGVMGNVYMTHDHPLDFKICMELNTTYDDLLRSSLHHNHARVCSVAEVVMSSYENYLMSTDAPRHVLEQVAEATGFLRGESNAEYFSIPSSSIDYLNSSSKTKERNRNSTLNIKEPKVSKPLNIKEQSTSNIKEPDNTGTLNIKEGDIKGSSNIKALSSCSSNTIKTTTTKTGNMHFAKIVDEKLFKEITERFPDMDTPQHKQIGRMVMNIDLEEHRYSLIYELANKLKFGKKEIRNPLAYLGSLIGLLNSGGEPFTSMAARNYKPNQSQSDKPKEKTTTVRQEINGVRSELSAVANEISALEKMQQQSPNDFFEQQLDQYKQQAKALSEKKAMLEDKQQTLNVRH